MQRIDADLVRIARRLLRIDGALHRIARGLLRIDGALHRIAHGVLRIAHGLLRIAHGVLRIAAGSQTIPKRDAWPGPDIVAPSTSYFFSSASQPPSWKRLLDEGGEARGGEWVGAPGRVAGSAGPTCDLSARGAPELPSRGEVSMGSFEGKIAIVTGGASGIGRAVCEALGARGATVVVADIAADAAAEVARGITGRGGRAEGKPLDVRDADAVAKLVGDTAAAHGRLDYLFNNAGIAIMGEERDVSLDDWRRVLDIDLNGVVYGVRAAYPIMLKQGHGHIVNTASLAGLVPAPGEISYVAAKFGVVGLSYSLRAEGARFGVKVSVVCPGFIDTPILHTSPIRFAADRARLLKMVPKPMPPEEAARVILRGVEKNRATIVVTGHAKLLWALHRLSPSITLRIGEWAIDRLRSARESP